jgi:hypothetical protein
LPADIGHIDCEKGGRGDDRECSGDIGNEDILVIEEQWPTREDLERHIRSDRFKEILSLLESASRPPEVSFHEISKTTGMGTIKAARSEKG